MNKKGTLAKTSATPLSALDRLPPILLQHATPAIEKKVKRF